MTYGNNNTFSTTTGIGYKLNTDVLDWLTAGDNQEKLKSMIIPSIWYQNSFKYGNSYEVSLNETNPTRSIENVQVGLIRIGEILSGQSYSILTKNGIEVSNYKNATGYWTMTPYTSSSIAWYLYFNGNADTSSANSTYGLRPVINVNSNVTITSGNGTLGHEYIVEVK